MPDEKKLPDESDIPMGWEVVATFYPLQPKQQLEANGMRDEFRRNGQSACVTVNDGRYCVWAQVFTKWPPPTSSLTNKNKNNDNH